MKKLTFLLIIIALAASTPLFSQEQLGLRVENYAGINGVSLNPTHSLNYPHAWNLNLIGTGFFFDNNYAFITNATVGSLARNENEVDFAPNYKNKIPPSDASLLDFPTNHRNRYLHFHSITNGPGFGLKLGKNHAFGLFFNARIEGSAAKIPKILNFYYLDTIPYNTKLTAPIVNAAFMGWRELGINYAYQGETNNGFFQIGINAKFLTGYESAFARSNSSFIFTRFKNDSIQVDAPSVSYGFSNANFNNIKNSTYELQPTGSGMGFDLGFSILVDADDFDNYGLRIGAAIIDIGQVNYSEKVEEHLIQYNQTSTYTGKDYKGIKTPQEAIETLSKQAYNDVKKSFVDNAYSIGLPTALSVQADYQFFQNAYANVAWIQRLPYQKIGVRRTNVLSVGARYEHRWFGGMTSLQIYEYQRVRLGFAARLAFLTVGSDNIGSFIGKSKLSGTDFYVAFKLNPFGLNLGKLRWFNGFGKRGKNVDCYKF